MPTGHIIRCYIKKDPRLRDGKTIREQDQLCEVFSGPVGARRKRAGGSGPLGPMGAGLGRSREGRGGEGGNMYDLECPLVRSFAR